MKTLVAIDCLLRCFRKIEKERVNEEERIRRRVVKSEDGERVGKEERIRRVGESKRRGIERKRERERVDKGVKMKENE